MCYEPCSTPGAVRGQLGEPYETRESKPEEQKRQAASGAARLQLGDASVQPCNRSGTGG